MKFENLLLLTNYFPSSFFSLSLSLSLSFSFSSTWAKKKFDERNIANKFNIFTWSYLIGDPKKRKKNQKDYFIFDFQNFPEFSLISKISFTYELLAVFLYLFLVFWPRSKAMVYLVWMAGAQLLLLLLLPFLEELLPATVVREFRCGREQNRREREKKKNLYIFLINSYPAAPPPPTEVDFISHTLPCFPLDCLVFFRIFFFLIGCGRVL